MRLTLFLITLLCTISTTLLAQTIKQHSGWLFLMNNTKITEKWGAYMDVQLRSADQFDRVRNLMFRPGVTYDINKKSQLTLGYLLNETFNTPSSGIGTLTEHRIWEQYIYKHKVSTANFSHRFRLEQRFIERANNEDLFAQRFRYFFRIILPLQKDKQNFDKGPFAALQNEVFLNVQHKNELNGYVFDQNRAYVAAGYRFGPKLDIELGYMNQSSKGASRNTMNNITQLAVYTRF